MKYKGKTISPPPSQFVDIIREDQTITFECKSVVDYTDFDSLVPEPKPPVINKISTGETYPDFEDATYRKKLNERGTKRVFFEFIWSIKDNTDVEFELVQPNDPDTWELIDDELNAFMTPYEKLRLRDAITLANNPTEKGFQEALKNSPATLQADNDQSSDQTEQDSSQNSESVNDSVSDHVV